MILSLFTFVSIQLIASSVAGVVSYHYNEVARVADHYARASSQAVPNSDVNNGVTFPARNFQSARLKSAKLRSSIRMSAQNRNNTYELSSERVEDLSGSETLFSGSVFLRADMLMDSSFLSTLKYNCENDPNFIITSLTIHWSTVFDRKAMKDVLGNCPIGRTTFIVEPNEDNLQDHNFLTTALIFDLGGYGLDSVILRAPLTSDLMAQIITKLFIVYPSLVHFRIEGVKNVRSMSEIGTLLNSAIKLKEVFLDFETSPTMEDYWTLYNSLFRNKNIESLTYDVTLHGGEDENKLFFESSLYYAFQNMDSLKTLSLPRMPSFDIPDFEDLLLTNPSLTNISMGIDKTRIIVRDHDSGEVREIHADVLGALRSIFKQLSLAMTPPIDYEIKWRDDVIDASIDMEN